MSIRSIFTKRSRRAPHMLLVNAALSLAVCAVWALVFGDRYAAVMTDPDLADAPLTLVVQDLPATILPGSEELAEYVARLAWPREVAGAILAQEIKFRDTSSEDPSPRPARLYSGALREEGIETTLLQLRPTEEELEAAGSFAEDDIQLRGGPQVAPGVIAALRYGLNQDPDELD